MSNGPSDGRPVDSPDCDHSPGDARPVRLTSEDSSGGVRDRPRKRRRRRRHRDKPPGTPPGTLRVSADLAAGPARVTLFAYGPQGMLERQCAALLDVKQALQTHPVLWVNVDGLGDVELVRQLGELFGLHPLALEDTLTGMQRPKVEDYGKHLYLTAHMHSFGERLEHDQLSLFLTRRAVITFQGVPGDPFDPVRQRIRTTGSRIREFGPDYLAYALLDSLIDTYFPLLEVYEDRLESLEQQVLEHPGTTSMAAIHMVRRDLQTLRRTIAPLRDEVNILLREHGDLIRPETLVYLRDCYDHSVLLRNVLEGCRENAASLMDLHMSSINLRMNEIMKVLTIIGTIFLPLTFISGVYGMNFSPQAGPLSMPELSWRYGYLAVLGLMTVIAVGMLLYFRWRGWLGRERPLR